MIKYKTLNEIDIRGKRVFTRVDFNVTYKNGGVKPLDYASVKITSDDRIRAAKPTIDYLLKNKAKIILASHLGKPDGEVNLAFTLEPVAHHLSNIIGKQVLFLPNCVGHNVEEYVSGMHEGEIILLENLRYHKGEESNDPEFIKKLANLADAYVFDAFGTAHRRHASTYGLPLLLKQEGRGAALGFLMEREAELWQDVAESLKAGRRNVLIVGGSKLKEKMPAIRDLADYFSLIIPGGVPFNMFQKVQGCSIGASLVSEKGSDKDYVQSAKDILEKYKDKIVLASSVHVSRYNGKAWEGKFPMDVSEGIPEGSSIVDVIHTNTLEARLKGVDSVVAFGPLGVYESGFNDGTEGLIQMISKASPNAVFVVGGGDSAAAYCNAPNVKKSTGGGASISFMRDGTLAALEALALE